jgi:hypothetical protein
MRSFIKVAEVANKTSVLPQKSSNCNTSDGVDEINPNEAENMTINPILKFFKPEIESINCSY